MAATCNRTGSSPRGEVTGNTSIRCRRRKTKGSSPRGEVTGNIASSISNSVSGVILPSRGGDWKPDRSFPMYGNRPILPSRGGDWKPPPPLTFPSGWRAWILPSRGGDWKPRRHINERGRRGGSSPRGEVTGNQIQPRRRPEIVRSSPRGEVTGNQIQPRRRPEIVRSSPRGEVTGNLVHVKLYLKQIVILPSRGGDWKRATSFPRSAG